MQRLAIARLARVAFGWIAAGTLGVASIACSPESPAPRAEAPAPEPSGLELVSPAGEFTGPIEFRWQPSRFAVSYRLRFIDQREREIYTIELKETRHTLPASVLDQMETTVTYSWRVDALDKDGRTIETTRILSFLWTR